MPEMPFRLPSAAMNPGLVGMDAVGDGTGIRPFHASGEKERCTVHAFEI